MKTPDYLNQAKLSLGVESDYALAARLSVSRSYMSRLRLGRNTLSDELAVQIAQIINVPAPLVLADAHVERETNPTLKAAWEKMATMLNTVKMESIEGFNLLLDLAVGGQKAKI